MSRSSRRGDDYAPAMFPFLAVLLCTIGALVLILVISVVHSHASAKRDLDEEIQVRVEQAQEQSDYLHSITEELAARREKIKQEIDRRRKELANVEDHIARLKVQMDQLRSQMEGIESVDDQDEQGRKAKADKIAQLKKQIDARQRELAEEVQRLKNRKPAFSIIPYDGPNGTSRRPVYIECKSDGVVIQPEGIRLSMRDLRPPYGPGNPLDSALRVLRNAYQQRDATFGLNIPPYPLLIVRPDGIESYAMARAAMSGWDDQFGYELIDAEMELAFPPGIPSLANDLQVALDTARKRQDMLLAALPREYVRSKNLEEIDLDSITPDSYRDTSSPEGDGTSWGDDAGEWKMVQEVGGAPTPSNIASQGASRSPQGASSSTQGARSKAVGEFSPLSIPQGLPNTNAGSHPSSQTAQGRPGGSPGAAWAPGDALAYGDTSGSGSASSGGASETGNAASGSEGSSGTSSGNSGSSGGTANAQNSQSRSNAFSSGNAMGNASMSMGGSEAPSDPESEALGNAMRENQRNEESNPKKNSNPSASRQGKSNSETNDSPQRESSNNQDWAIPRHDRKATPVSRSIRIVALEDRWLIRKEDSETQFTTEIELALGPRQARETLEKAVRDRVDSWGLSLPGGYWVPAITIEAANDAQQSVDRLRKMLDGSGVEIRVVPLQAPAARQSPSKISPSRNVPSRR